MFIEKVIIKPVHVVCACISAMQWRPVLPHLAEMEYLLLQTSDSGSEAGTSNIRNVWNFTFYAWSCFLL